MDWRSSISVPFHVALKICSSGCDIVALLAMVMGDIISVPFFDVAIKM